MKKRVLLIRPQEDALPLAKILESRGIEVRLYPLFEPYSLPLPSLEDPQAFIITSKNALRSLGGHEEFKKVPLYVVGDQTAQFAKQMGFPNIKSASGTSRELKQLILNEAHPKKGILWHLSGEFIKNDIVSELKVQGFKAERRAIYCIREIKNFPQDLIFDVSNQKITHVMFFSPRTTSFFVNLLNKNKLEKFTYLMTALCLSHDVAEEIQPLNWEKIWICPQPTTQSMMGYFNEEE